MARKKKKAEGDNELRWLTTYGDVVTLLLAFFVMLYAISRVDEQKFMLFVAGLQDPFGNEAVSDGLLAQGTGIVGGAYGEEEVGDEEGFDGLAVLDGLPELDDDVATTEPPPANLDPERLLNSLEDLRYVEEAVSSALTEAGFEDAAHFELDARGLIIAIATDDVLFASGSAVFGERGHEIIAAIAPSLLEFDNEVLVEGHTDSVPLRRAGYDNWNLSADRALAVLKLLTDSFGIDSTRLAATGFGEFRPKATNETEDGKAQNRRVELVVVADVDQESPGESSGSNGGERYGGA